MKRLGLTLSLLASLFVVGCSTNDTSSSSIEPISHSYSTKLKEVVIEEQNLEGEGGNYSYSLKVKPDLTLTMDIDLTITYQEIDGKYNFHYEIDKDKNHIMVVSGKFDNVIVNSPLVEQLNPGIVSKLINIAESLGFLTKDSETDDYAWIEDLCNDPQNWVLTNISDDSYSYKLDLRTAEGFTFVNALSLYLFGVQRGYTIDYEYTLSNEE